MRARGLAGDDAFAVGSTLTVPLAATPPGTPSPPSPSLGIDTDRHDHPQAHPRRRLPAADRQPARCLTHDTTPRRTTITTVTAGQRRPAHPPPAHRPGPPAPPPGPPWPAAGSRSARTPRARSSPRWPPRSCSRWSSRRHWPRSSRPPGRGGVDYRTFVIVGTVGLLIPLTCTFAGIGVIVDRATGARRELLAAPIPRALIVLGNMAVAIGVSAAASRRADGSPDGRAAATSTPPPAASAGSSAPCSLFTVFMYGLAEILANRIPTQEEYVGLTPVVAILPWFLAGSLFPITALPAGLAGVARALPTTHVLALLRYGLARPHRRRPARHLGNDQHHHRRRPEPAGPGRLGDPHHRSGHPRLHPLGGELTRTHPPNLLAGPTHGPSERAHIGHESKAPQPRDRAVPLVYFRVAALNLATRSAGTCPRSFHLVRALPAGPRPPRAGHCGPPPADGPHAIATAHHAGKGGRRTAGYSRGDEGAAPHPWGSRPSPHVSR